MDVDKLKMLKELLEEQFPSLIELFSTDAPKNLSIMRNALECLDDDNRTRLKKTAHALKGSSANLGAVTISNLAYKVECGSESLPAKELEMLIDTIEAELAQFLEQIKRNFL